MTIQPIALSRYETGRKKRPLRPMALATVSCLLLSCSSSETRWPQGNFHWTPTTPSRNTDLPGQAPALKTAQNTCTRQSETKTIPPDACKPPPRRTCAGADYASGECPPEKPPEPECNNGEIQAAFDAREKLFLECMKQSGWKAVWTPAN